jgi:hypothetical protein
MANSARRPIVETDAVQSKGETTPYQILKRRTAKLATIALPLSYQLAL